MAKKKKTPQIQLSPENYIKKRARLLPIGKCYINEEWIEQGIANIIITRIHGNGNMTAGVYLVDMLCLGTTESFYFFNITAEELNDVLEQSKSEEKEMIEESYTLLHNIIFSANNFADDFGFIPCKEFRNITRYILADDETDEVEMMEIECGDDDGLPVYIPSKNDSPQKIQSVLSTLERTAGEDNFTFIEHRDDLIDDDDPFEDPFSREYIMLSEEVEEMTLDEKMNTLHQLKEELFSEEHYDSKIIATIRLITDKIIEPFVDLKKIGEEVVKYGNLEEIEISEIEELDLFFEEKQKLKLTKELEAEIIQINNDPPALALEKVAALQKRHGLFPYFCFLEVMFLKNSKKDEQAQQKAEEYSNLYPDYALLKIERYATLLTRDGEINHSVPSTWNDYFANRERIHPTEIFHFIMLKTILIQNSNNANSLTALSIFISILNDMIDDELLDMLDAMMFSTMISFVTANFKQDTNGRWKAKLQIQY